MAVRAPEAPPTTEAGRKLTDLARRYQGGDESAVSEVVQRIWPMVQGVAGRYLNRRGRGQGRYDLDDLVVEGLIGVIEALGRYDGRGAFSTYARHWIHRKIADFTIRNASTITVLGNPYHALATYRRTQEIRLPGYQCQDAARRAIEATARALQCGSFQPPTQGMVQHDPADRAESPEATLVRREQLDRLRSALGGLPSRSREILVRHYGLDGREPQTYRAIAQAMGMREATVSYAAYTARIALRRALGTSLNPNPKED